MIDGGVAVDEITGVDDEIRGENMVGGRETVMTMRNKKTIMTRGVGTTGGNSKGMVKRKKLEGDIGQRLVLRIGNQTIFGCGVEIGEATRERNILEGTGGRGIDVENKIFAGGRNEIGVGDQKAITTGG